MTDTNTETLSSDAGGGQIVKKKGKIPFAVKIAGGVLALVFGGVWALTPSSPDVQPVVSTVGSGTQVNSTPGGEIQRTNEDYARQIELQNDINAKKAEDSGESFIPFLEKPLEPITTTEENIKVEDEMPVDTAPKRVVSTEVRTNEAPIPVVKRTPVETQQQTQQQQQENPYLKNMISTFGAITDGMKPKKSASEELDSNRLAELRHGLVRGYGVRTGIERPARCQSRPERAGPGRHRPS